MKQIRQTIEFLENTPLNVRTWCVSFLAILGVRYLVDSLLTGFAGRTIEDFVGILIHSLILFFAFSYLLMVLLVVWLTKEQFSKVAAVLLWGQWLVIFPPIIDKLIFGNKSYWSFYILDSFSGMFNRYFQFFGKRPDFGITYGTRMEVLLVTVLVAVYVFYKTKNYWRTLLGAWLVYSILFILGTFPSWWAYILGSLQTGSVKSFTETNIAAMFLSPLHLFNSTSRAIESAIHYRMALIYLPLLFLLLVATQWRINKNQLWALIRNIRFPQTIFNSGLLLLGMALGFWYLPERPAIDIFSILLVINLLLMVFCCWYFSVFVNDVADLNIDKITNQDRPLTLQKFTIQQYWDYSLIFLLLSLLAGLAVGSKVFLLVLVYHFLTFVYSYLPFRLKRFVGVASLLAAGASLLFFLVGFLVVSGEQTMALFPWRIATMLFIGYFLAIPLKDIKDIEGDRADGVWTLPVLVGEKRARQILSVLVFICYFSSVFVFNERRLSLPALLCGALSVWIINNLKIKPRNVNWQVLLTAAVYVIILVAILLYEKSNLSQI